LASLSRDTGGGRELEANIVAEKELLTLSRFWTSEWSNVEEADPSRIECTRDPYNTSNVSYSGSDLLDLSWNETIRSQIAKSEFMRIEVRWAISASALTDSNTFVSVVSERQ
jgi:hypothetical protein